MTELVAESVNRVGKTPSDGHVLVGTPPVGVPSVVEDQVAPVTEVSIYLTYGPRKDGKRRVKSVIRVGDTVLELQKTRKKVCKS